MRVNKREQVMFVEPKLDTPMPKLTCDLCGAKMKFIDDNLQHSCTNKDCPAHIPSLAEEIASV